MSKGGNYRATRQLKMQKERAERKMGKVKEKTSQLKS